MEIKVIGAGCQTCKKLLELTKKTVKDMNVDANIIYVTDMAEIAKLQIMKTPALMINDKIQFMGKIPKDSELKSAIHAQI